MTYVITEPCIDLKDATCVDVCPVDCIFTTEEARQYYIDPATCIDCSACEAVCPVTAIFYEEDVPEDQREYTEINRRFFEEHENIGGSFRPRSERI